MRTGTLLLLAVCLSAAAAAARAQPADVPYREIYYASGTLRIQAYLYKPEGDGPFPAVIYNHGSREGRERESFPFPHIGALLTRAGYVALVPERRGYGKSDGPSYPEEAVNAAQLIPRLQNETDDVLAALDYLRTLPYADMRRVGIMGWSFGGIVTMLATSRGKAFTVAVDQAGGALTWDRNPGVQTSLRAAARASETPTLFMAAKNDRTTASVSTLADLFKERGVPHRLVIYEPFVPSQGGIPGAPGHAIFSSQGVSVWERDVVEFLGRYLKATP